MRPATKRLTTILLLLLLARGTWAALPNKVDPTSPADTDLVSAGAGQIRGVKQYLVDVFGVPNNSNVTAIAMTVSTAGLVGISQSGFVITGTARITGAAPSLEWFDSTAAAKSLTIATDANVADLRESAGASGSLLALDLANARVGIGLNSPSALLHMSGIVGYRNLNVSMIQRGSNAGLMIEDAGALGAVHLTQDGGVFKIYTKSGAGNFVGSDLRLTIDASGNVGIGGTPSVPLDVTGTVNIAVGSQTLSARAVSGTAYLGTTNNTSWYLGNNLSTTPSIYLQTGPVVAIGGNNPMATLHIRDASGTTSRPFSMDRTSTAVVAPGANIGMLRFETGTNAGTCKLVVYGGLSATGITIADNIGAGCS